MAERTPDAVEGMLASLDDRYGARASLVTSQFPVEDWHELIGDPTLADAILDRLVYHSCEINLMDESIGKKRTKLFQTEHSDKQSRSRVAESRGRGSLEAEK